MIKNFLYLDVEKLHSLSSQVFEGITEYILDETFSEKQENESQKGPIGSGRIIGDILKLGEKVSERKYLHDYSYTLFEEKLIEDKKVSIFDASKQPSTLGVKSFIKITSKAVFNDIKSVNYTLENFNEIGRALAHVSKYQEITLIKEELIKLKSQARNKGERAKLDRETKKLTNLNAIAKEQGLYQDQKFLDDLALVLKFGFQDQLEIQMKLADMLFSANLKRDCLREDEHLIIRKYSRHTEVKTVLFGIVTQHGDMDEIEGDAEEQEYNNIKEAIMNLVAHITNIESTFTGRLNNEVVIDPIALYTEI